MKRERKRAPDGEKTKKERSNNLENGRDGEKKRERQRRKWGFI